MVLVLLLVSLLLPSNFAAVTIPWPRLAYDVALGFKPAFCSILENKPKTINTGGQAFDLGLSSFTGDM